MSSLRANKTKGIGDISISTIKDFQTDEITDLVSGETKPAGIPQSNVLLYELGDDLGLVCSKTFSTSTNMEVREIRDEVVA